MNTRRKWTNSENQVLIQMRPRLAAGKITLEQIMQILPGRTASAINDQMLRLGLTKQHPCTKKRPALPKASRWTNDEDDIIIENANRPKQLRLTANELKKHLPGRTETAIQKRIQRLGLANTTHPTQDLKPGDRIHYLTLIEKIPAKNFNDHITRWRCQCICRKEIIVDAPSLTSKDKRIQSCGCYKEKLRIHAAHRVKTGFIDGTNVLRMQNQNPNKNTTTGQKNIFYIKKSQTYLVQFEYKRKKYTAGRAKDLEQAIKIRDAFRTRLMPEIEALDAERQAQLPELVKKFKAEFNAESTSASN